MLVDQNTESVTVPLNAQLHSEGKLELANSKPTLPGCNRIQKLMCGFVSIGSLSEYAVLGVCHPQFQCNGLVTDCLRSLNMA